MAAMSAELTIYDIATRAGVGIATVSRVLNGSARVSSATRAAVQQAMHDLGFRPNRAARRLAAGGPNRPRIAALLPLFSSDFYFSVSRPMAQILLAEDMDLVLFDIDITGDEAKDRLLDRIIQERSCEGVIFCSMGIGQDRQAQLLNLGIPFVCVDYHLPGAPCITVDNVHGGALATRHVLACGSTRPALINGPLTGHAFRDRLRGFQEAAGPDQPVITADILTREAGAAACANLLRRFPATDGIVCASDILAVGVLETLTKQGRQVPQDIQVVGFDDQPLMDFLGLTTVRQPMADFGAWSARSIAALVRTPGTTVPSVEQPLALITRTTTRGPMPGEKLRKKNRR